jgi:Penicillin amidase
MAYSIGRWLWKAFLLAFLTVVGAFAASQMGWSGAKAIVKVFEGQDTLTDFLFGLAMLVLFGVLRYIRRVARRALWVAIPIWPGESGVPGDRQYGDLVEGWANGEYHPVPFSRKAVEAAAESARTAAGG